MSEVVKFPGSGLTNKKAGAALVRVTVNAIQRPLQIASECRKEFRSGALRNFQCNDLSPGHLLSAKHNFKVMLPRAGLVDAAYTALLPVTIPCLVRPITPDVAIMMLSALFGALGKKSNDSAALLDACVSMLAPDADDIGEATGLWLPISKSPLIVALAIKRLINQAIFTPAPAEFRREMREANCAIKNLVEYSENWLELLKASDRIVFKFDRVSWDFAYQNIGLEAVQVMQDSSERPEIDDEGADIAPSPRWAAQEKMRLAKQEGG